MSGISYFRMANRSMPKPKACRAGHARQEQTRQSRNAVAGVGQKTPTEQAPPRGECVSPIAVRQMYLVPVRFPANWG